MAVRLASRLLVMILGDLLSKSDGYRPRSRSRRASDTATASFRCVDHRGLMSQGRLAYAGSRLLAVADGVGGTEGQNASAADREAVRLSD
ncbi:MAG: hypothetical protein QOE61_1596 [Micromonosporaceae bacterium]|nr:hypothetical protein [Micromonosporaceae bacterium]